MLSSEEARQLDRFVMAPSAAPAAAHASGARLANARGFGLEFHDFRPYRLGDDPRRIDWNICARLDQLVVRQFRADAHLRLHLLVDTSSSMGVGLPDKLSCAKKVAALLAYVAVRERDAVGLSSFAERTRKHV